LPGHRSREDDHLVEIGPGRGALTEALLQSGCRLDAIELDRDLATPLLAAFSIYPALPPAQRRRPEASTSALLRSAKHQPLRVVGNLPYNISTPLIFRLLEQANSSRTCISCCSSRWCSA
jgi:16S rRNA (adenine1518-N6/adenine1519-N6)-dimethyltransferase